MEAALSRRYRTDRGFGVGYDRAACSAINPLSSQVVKVSVTALKARPDVVEQFGQTHEAVKQCM